MGDKAGMLQLKQNFKVSILKCQQGTEKHRCYQVNSIFSQLDMWCKYPQLMYRYYNCHCTVSTHYSQLQVTHSSHQGTTQVSTSFQSKIFRLNLACNLCSYWGLLNIARMGKHRISNQLLLNYRIRRSYRQGYNLCHLSKGTRILDYKKCMKFLRYTSKLGILDHITCTKNTQKMFLQDTLGNTCLGKGSNHY